MTTHIDLYTLTILQKALEQVCTEMAAVLRRTAYSPNIKERKDFSTAVFGSDGRLVSSKAGIPVHLGSMEEAIKASLAHHDRFRPGDVLVHNDPYEGGTHLPDINLLAPVFVGGGEGPTFWTACRAHHADVGGMTPGSMPSNSTTLFEEGIRIPPIKLWEGGEKNRAAWDLLLANVRTPVERAGDFNAQRAALQTGEKRLEVLAGKYGLTSLLAGVEALEERAQEAMRKFLRQVAPGTTVGAVDYLDLDGLGNEVRLEVTVSWVDDRGGLRVDFTGSSPQQPNNCNATAAITRSATYYVLRYLLAEWGDLPTNSGLWHPLTIHLPPKSVVNASFPAATSSGNVETSQRIVDVLFKAMANVPEMAGKVPAASQGTMNNVVVGGWAGEQFFSYYETLGGGAGAMDRMAGESGIHTHMTNTLNTPVEALELSYPLRVIQYRLRKNSGGTGQWTGGDGLVREYEVLADEVTYSLQTERRVRQPWGLQGGQDGATGENWVKELNGDWGRVRGRASGTLRRGGRLKVLTPGGGGYGMPPTK